MQGHGYWFHGVLQFLGYIYWNTYARNRQMMVDNRRRYDERQAEKQAEKEKKSREAAAEDSSEPLTNDSASSKKVK